MRPTSSIPLVIFLSLLVSACSSAATPKTPQALQLTAVSTALFQIIRADGGSLGITIADLKTLPLAQVFTEEKVEEGPKLLDVLALADVTGFTKMTLTGSSNSACPGIMGSNGWH